MAQVLRKPTNDLVCLFKLSACREARLVELFKEDHDQGKIAREGNAAYEELGSIILPDVF